MTTHLPLITLQIVLHTTTSNIFSSNNVFEIIWLSTKEGVTSLLCNHSTIETSNWTVLTTTSISHPFFRPNHFPETHFLPNKDVTLWLQWKIFYLLRLTDCHILLNHNYQLFWWWWDFFDRMRFICWFMTFLSFYPKIYQHFYWKLFESIAKLSYCN